MELIIKGNDHPSKLCITILPFIDLSPSDESCIYSILLYIIDQARQKKIFTLSVVFDQPLRIKSMEIVNAKGLKIVARLGGFQTLMSFIRSLGIIMEWSGLEKALETVYKPNTVTHIFSDRALSRALRTHFLVHFTKIWSFLLRISSVNATKSVVSCGFGHIYWRNP